MWKPTRLHAQQISLSMFEILACCTLDITAGVITHLLLCGTQHATLVR